MHQAPRVAGIDTAEGINRKRRPAPPGNELQNAQRVRARMAFGFEHWRQQCRIGAQSRCPHQPRRRMGGDGQQSAAAHFGGRGLARLARRRLAQMQSIGLRRIGKPWVLGDNQLKAVPAAKGFEGHRFPGSVWALVIPVEHQCAGGQCAQQWARISQPREIGHQNRRRQMGAAASEIEPPCII